MRIRLRIAVVFFFLATSGVLVTAEQPSSELFAIQEAYRAATDNLVSGSGTGKYEIFEAQAGKGTKLELKIKARVKIFFDHGKFNIHLDYEKDDYEHLESRIIVYDGSAILVNRKSKDIHPHRSEGDVYEAEPNLSIMRQAGFDYNPCALPANVLSVEALPKYAAELTVISDANMDYSGKFNIPPVVRCTFLASRKAGFNIVSYGERNTNHNNFQHVNRLATWERKKNIWYVKSIDNTFLVGDGSGQRMVFSYTDFDPNVDVSSSLFKFDALSLPRKARLIDRRPNAEEPVLRQSQSSIANVDQLNTLADSVKSFTPKSTPLAPPQSGKFRRLYLLTFGALLCILGLSLLWRRSRQGNINTQRK